MAKSKPGNYAFTSFEKDSLKLLIGEEEQEEEYVISYVSMSFATNEIPSATCVLAIGRLGEDGTTEAKVHQTAETLLSLQKAKIVFRPTGDRTTSGDKWDDQEQVIFDGRFMGFTYRKGVGQVQIVAQLVHWLIDMTFSSILSASSHPQNPSSLVFPTIAELGPGAGTDAKPTFLFEHAAYNYLRDRLDTDWWQGVKEFLYAVTQQDPWDPLGAEGCLGIETVVKNTGAAEALARIEGPTELAESNRPYKFGKPLVMFTNGIDEIKDSAAEWFQSLGIDSVGNSTLWDVLVGGLLPAFGLALVPLVDTAIVVADVPGYRTPSEIPFTANHYLRSSFSPTIPMPLRGVAVVTALEARAGSGEPFKDTGATQQGLGGCFLSPDRLDAGGVVMMVSPPNWLQVASSAGLDARTTTGNGDGEAIGSSTTPEAGKAAAAAAAAPVGLGDVSELYNRYAQLVFIQNTLRGRSGNFAGPLRFDVAPGTMLKLDAAPETFIGGSDKLAATLYGTVFRVTITLNAEQPAAETTFEISHLRTEKENEEDRSSIAFHPFFEDPIVTGAPLLEAYEHS